MADLLDLAKRCEKASGPDRELDREIWYALQHVMSGDPAHGPHFTASLDAAMTLVPERWEVERASWHSLGQPTAGFRLFEHRQNISGEWWHSSKEGIVDGAAVTPALALCGAALRARAQGQPS